jgi:WhiB family redox-sensing transcriptional regulator
MLRDLVTTTAEQYLWAEQAACRGYRLEHGDDAWRQVWFPEPGAPNSSKRAKAICATCPVRADCLDWAVRNRISSGIWGGTTESERRRQASQLRRKHGTNQRRPRPECGTEAGYTWEKRHGETTCTACRAAHSFYVQWAKRRRAVTA